MSYLIRTLGALVLAVTLTGCGGPDPGPQSLEVTATAYTLSPEETDDGPRGLAAWGDVLKPGMNAIAVSRDLIEMGLDHMTKVKIEGLEGTYVVMDKMAARWEKKIDILMSSREKAMEWGKRTVTIHWTNPPQPEE